MGVDYAALFEKLHPGFFELAAIRGLPAEKFWDEMALELRNFSDGALRIEVPEGIAFGYYRADMEPLWAAVRVVDADWAQYFEWGKDIFCAFDGGKVVSFCLIEDMARFGSLKVGGPGCVGTVPEYRGKGIGLKLVQGATQILKDAGYDISYIHYTGVAAWYAKLGYRTVLRWSSRGCVEACE